MRKTKELSRDSRYREKQRESRFPKTYTSSEKPEQKSIEVIAEQKLFICTC
jgi:hypothetical protein